MPESDDGKRRPRAAAWLLFATVTFCCVLRIANLSQAEEPNTAPLTRRVMVTSDPPGATIWAKEGKALICKNLLTPAMVELNFRDTNDVKRIRLRRFGYAGKNLNIKATDEKVGAVLHTLSAHFFAGRG